jgi:hypothetical protein
LGVTAFDAFDAVESPITLEATKVKVYGVSLVSPATVQVKPVAGVGVQVLVASSTAVTV